MVLGDLMDFKKYKTKTSKYFAYYFRKGFQIHSLHIKLALYLERANALWNG
jgi:hypothetical protein